MKKRWGSHPARERGDPTRSERTYLGAVERARRAGAAAAGDPKLTVRDCPPRYGEDERAYWLAAFRQERRKKP